jgi:hypothetical protein
MEALLDNFDTEIDPTNCVEWFDENESYDTAREQFCDEIDAWARHAMTANGFGDY